MSQQKRLPSLAIQKLAEQKSTFKSNLNRRPVVSLAKTHNSDYNAQISAKYSPDLYDEMYQNSEWRNPHSNLPKPENHFAYEGQEFAGKATVTGIPRIMGIEDRPDFELTREGFANNFSAMGNKRAEAEEMVKGFTKRIDQNVGNEEHKDFGFYGLSLKNKDVKREKFIPGVVDAEYSEIQQRKNKDPDRDKYIDPNIKPDPTYVSKTKDVSYAKKQKAKKQGGMAALKNAPHHQSGIGENTSSPTTRLVVLPAPPVIAPGSGLTAMNDELGGSGREEMHDTGKSPSKNAPLPPEDPPIPSLEEMMMDWSQSIDFEASGNMLDFGSPKSNSGKNKAKDKSNTNKNNKPNTAGEPTKTTFYQPNLDEFTEVTTELGIGEKNDQTSGNGKNPELVAMYSMVASANQDKNRAEEKLRMSSDERYVTLSREYSQIQLILIEKEQHHMEEISKKEAEINRWREEASEKSTHIRNLESKLRELETRIVKRDNRDARFKKILETVEKLGIENDPNNANSTNPNGISGIASSGGVKANPSRKEREDLAEAARLNAEVRLQTFSTVKEIEQMSHLHEEELAVLNKHLQKEMTERQEEMRRNELLDAKCETLERSVQTLLNEKKQLREQVERLGKSMMQISKGNTRSIAGAENAVQHAQHAVQHGMVNVVAGIQPGASMGASMSQHGMADLMAGQGIPGSQNSGNLGGTKGGNVNNNTKGNAGTNHSMNTALAIFDPNATQCGGSRAEYYSPTNYDYNKVVMPASGIGSGYDYHTGRDYGITSGLQLALLPGGFTQTQQQQSQHEHGIFPKPDQCGIMSRIEHDTFHWKFPNFTGLLNMTNDLSCLLSPEFQVCNGRYRLRIEMYPKKQVEMFSENFYGGSIQTETSGFSMYGGKRVEAELDQSRGHNGDHNSGGRAREMAGQMCEFWIRVLNNYSTRLAFKIDLDQGNKSVGISHSMRGGNGSQNNISPSAGSDPSSSSLIAFFPLRPNEIRPSIPLQHVLENHYDAISGELGLVFTFLEQVEDIVETKLKNKSVYTIQNWGIKLKHWKPGVSLGVTEPFRCGKVDGLQLEFYPFGDGSQHGMIASKQCSLHLLVPLLMHFRYFIAIDGVGEVRGEARGSVSTVKRVKLQFAKMPPMQSQVRISIQVT